MAKRGYTRDTIRGGASDWDVSRPFSSYLRTLGSLILHPVRFFETLPRIPDVRAPALFLIFCGLPAAVLWLVFGGVLPALVALVLPLPLSLVVAAPYHLGAWGGRFGYVVTWRVVAYPLGFCLPILAAPVLRWLAGFYFGVVVVSVGLRVVQEIPPARAAGVAVAVTSLLLLVGYWLIF